MQTMEIPLTDLDVEILVHLFDDLLQESIHQEDLCRQNEDYEELKVCSHLSSLYWRVLKGYLMMRDAR